MTKKIILALCVVFASASTVLAAQGSAKSSGANKPAQEQHFKITVQGIFPESTMQNKFANASDNDESPLTESEADSTTSLNNDQLKQNNAPGLKIDSAHSKRGKAYTVNGKRYRPFASIKEFSQVGIASWYGPGFHGRKTASGERFNQNSLTAAHKELPLNSVVRVTRVSTGKSVLVRITDRGPFHRNRVIDLSLGAAKQLGIVNKGAAKVKIELITNKKGKKNMM